MTSISHRFWSILPFLFALTVLVFLGWSVIPVLDFPYDGIPSMQRNGLIQQIDPVGPVANKLKKGDIIVSVDGAPVEVGPLYGGKRAGDTVDIIVDRQGLRVPVEVTLAKPSLNETLGSIVPLIVALIFCVIGIVIQTFKPFDGAASVYFLFFEASALVLAAGAVSNIKGYWISVLFVLMVWLIGPLSIHFHYHFPQTISIPHKRLSLALLYTLALVGALPSLLWGTKNNYAQPWTSAAVSISYRYSYLFLAINLIGVGILLLYAYRHTSTPGARSKIRIVVLGGLISALPLAAMTLLPIALALQPILPYPVAFLLLGILPLTYGYAIFRYHLIEIEKHVNRGATYILFYSILAGLYLILYSILQHWLPNNLQNDALINTILVLLLATIYSPLQQRFQNIVDTVFYGGWYDYRSAIRQITQNLEQITELQVLARTLSERLYKTMRVEDTCVFIRDINGEFSVIDVSPRRDLTNRLHLSFPVLPRSSLIYLLKMGEAGGRSSMQDALAEVALTPEEQMLLNSEQVHLWIPVIGHGQVQAYLALGPKYGGDIFSGEDMDILRVVARQLAPVIENIHLLNQLRKHAAELEQKVQERTEELSDAKERVEAILASVGDGVIVTDLEGRILTVNAVFEDQSGYASDELVGQTFFSLLAAHNDPTVLDGMRATLGRKEVWRGELVQRRDESQVSNLQLTIAPVYNRGDEVIGYVGSQRDITKQRELDRLKDQFISDVSHELRTPATNLGLYLELLEKAPIGKFSDYINILKGQCNLLTNMVEDILDLSRLELGRAKKVEFTNLDLNLLTQQVVIAHMPWADASNLHLAFEPAPDLPLVLGEHNQMARVITNLVSNAIRYTVKGAVRVLTYQSGERVCLEVSDTGIGIDREDLPHLFERFFRGRQVRRSKIHGTGLGLAIVKEIVDLHGGAITIESEIGKGSRFCVWLSPCVYNYPVQSLPGTEIPIVTSQN